MLDPRTSRPAGNIMNQAHEAPSTKHDAPRMIALSTAWNALRHTSGKKMAGEILKLGFDTLELSVHVTPAMADEVLAMAGRNRLRICGLHNYCPLPEGIEREKAAGNNLALSSTDEDERARAVAQTKETIEWAARLGAPAVVLHLGMVPVRIRQREALTHIGAGNRDQGRAIVTEDLMERGTIRGPYVDSVIRSLRDLAPRAVELGVKLGLETRYYYTEIPSLDEFMMIFRNVQSPALGYWHDTGHAHVMETLGIATQDDFLTKYGDRLIGIHLHDAVGGSDHRAIGHGNVDFEKVLSHAKPDTQLVLEIHGQASASDIIKSRERILKYTQIAREGES